MSESLPIISIAGRRNVGKSTLFNALLHSKIAIVDDMPGLTRDILTYRLNINGSSYLLSDTPGLDLPPDAVLSEKIISSAQTYLLRSSLVILLLENPNVEPFDLDLINYLRKKGIKTLVAVNKMDTMKDMENMSNFYETGLDDILPLSAKFRINIHLLTEKIEELVPTPHAKEHESDIKIALVGRPNAGKSTMLNSFLGFERSIVSSVPGTTRDSVNDSFTYNDKRIEIIDTAGLRKKSRVLESVEFFSVSRAIDSIKHCDVVIHIIDAKEGLCDTDKKIADIIVESRKPLIIALNKWDAIVKDDHTFEKYKDKLIDKFYRAVDFPIISVSATEKQRLFRLITTALELKEKASRRIETSKLNKALESIVKSGRLPGFGTKYKVYYATQINEIPPRFKLFVNNTDHFRSDVIRFFEKEFQRMMDLEGIPVSITLEGKVKGNPKGKKDSRVGVRLVKGGKVSKGSTGTRISREKRTKKGIQSSKGSVAKKSAKTGKSSKGNKKFRGK